MGLELYALRQELRQELLKLMEEQQWLGSLDHATRERLEARQEPVGAT